MVLECASQPQVLRVGRYRVKIRQHFGHAAMLCLQRRLHLLLGQVIDSEPGPFGRLHQDVQRLLVSAYLVGIQ